LPVRVDLVEMEGLGAKMKAMAPADADAMRARLAAAFRAEAYQGVGAAELSADRYALLRGGNAPAERVAERLKRAAGPNISPVVAELPIPADSVGQTVKAMRYALDRFIADGPSEAAKGFADSVRKTVEEAARFKAILTEGGFQLAYQPIVRLTDTRLHHFEALARFDNDVSPADTIRLAEELDLIVDFDMAVARCVGEVLAGRPDARIAVNVSALSLMQPRFIESLTSDMARDANSRRRMLLEVTETKQLEDLDAARKIIERLSQVGYVVCLDDFGAGAASLDYLRRLPVAYVKIDGRFIQKLHVDSREAVILKHVVALCSELKIGVIAEMIETRSAGEIARGLGVELGQGWAFSEALPEPVWAGPEAPAIARRKGERVQWS
jgi:EAL domain-containing protein (putative c-di-GMP-specific phosphodiesterase class I)